MIGKAPSEEKVCRIWNQDGLEQAESVLGVAIGMTRQVRDDFRSAETLVQDDEYEVFCYAKKSSGLGMGPIIGIVVGSALIVGVASGVGAH